MARFSGNVCNSYVHMDLLVTENSTSVDGNSSVVAWQLVGWLGTTSSTYWYSNNYHTINVKINGVTVYSLANTTQKSISIGTNHTQASPVIIASGTATVPHNADGSKTCACSFACTYRYNSAFSWSASGNLALTTIPRASSISSTSGNTINSNIQIAINRASNSFTHTITYAFGNATGTICTKTTSTSVPWTPPLSLCSQVTSATLGTCNLTVTTYNGSSTVGSKTYTFTLYLPSSIIPSVTGAGTAPLSDTTVVNNWGIYVQGYSKAKLTITGAGTYGSSISSYKVVYNGKTYSSASNVITIDVLVAVSNTINVYAVDSRGRTSARYDVNITAQAYNMPYLDTISCFRCNSAGAQSDAGTCLYLKSTAHYSSCSNKNAVSITYSIVKAINNASVASGSLTTSTATIKTGLSATITYKCTFKVQDTIGNSKEYTFIINTASVAFNLYPSVSGGAAFGKYAEYEQTLDIGAWDLRGGKAYITGDVLAGVGTTNQRSLLDLGDTVDELNSNLQWKQLTSVLGTSSVSLVECSELDISVWVAVGSEYYSYRTRIPYTSLDSTNTRICLGGYYYSSGDYGSCWINATKNVVTLRHFIYGGTNYSKSNCHISIKYRQLQGCPSAPILINTYSSF